MTPDHQPYVLTLWLAQKPCFCCGCWCLDRRDAERTRRVLRLVNAVVKSWNEQRASRGGGSKP